jgi:hypothetical protein
MISDSATWSSLVVRILFLREIKTLTTVNQ